MLLAFIGGVLFYIRGKKSRNQNMEPASGDIKEPSLAPESEKFVVLPVQAAAVNTVDGTQGTLVDTQSAPSNTFYAHMNQSLAVEQPPAIAVTPPTVSPSPPASWQATLPAPEAITPTTDPTIRTSTTSTTSTNNVRPSKLLLDSSDIEIDVSKPPLGEGSFGIVYRGLLKNSVPVAVKKIKGSIDPATIKAFEKEIVVWEGLVQKNGGFG